MGIKHTIKKTVLGFIPANVKWWINFEYSRDARLSYATEGEDLVLQRLMDYRKKGTFVDVGAHHPTKSSNTYYYYRQGWRGINIDAMPGSMQAFMKERPEDINLEIPVSDSEQELKYYIFNAADLNTFDSSKIEIYLKFPGVKLEREIILKTRTLEQILDEHFEKLNSSHIDFLSVDVEGLDLQVLKSNNWQKYRPDYVLAEDLFQNATETSSGKLATFMRSVGYELVSKTCNTAFFKSL
jgi:FkbM family methyltransferase